MAYYIGVGLVFIPSATCSTPDKWKRCSWHGSAAASLFVHCWVSWRLLLMSGGVNTSRVRDDGVRYWRGIGFHSIFHVLDAGPRGKVQLTLIRCRCAVSLRLYGWVSWRLLLMSEDMGASTVHGDVVRDRCRSGFIPFAT